MGTDIHGAVQIKWYENSTWYTSSEPMYTPRNYKLFSALADVRNAYGVSAIKPISLPRGVPEDFKVYLTDEYVHFFGCINCEFGVTTHMDPEGTVVPLDYDDAPMTKERKLEIIKYSMLGDHSQSWLTIDEILEWDGWSQKVNTSGIVERSEYSRWALRAAEPSPQTWNEGINGSNVIVASNITKHTGEREDYYPEGWTHIQTDWTAPLSYYVAPFLKWAEFIKEDNKDAYSVRIVFGFDS